MDEIIQILIFAGAMIFSVVIQSAKNKKKQETPSPQEVLEEVFPEMGDVPEGMTVEKQPVQKPVTPPRRKPFKPQIKPEAVKPAAPSVTPRKKPKVSLTTREEAKKAFIYSEIFKRKY